MKKIITFALLLSMVPQSDLYAKPQNTYGKYKINVGASGRASAPYSALPSYNNELTQTGTGPGYPTTVSRHHIIPYNTLRDFYNNVVNNGQLLQTYSFFNSFAENLRFYAAQGGTDCSTRHDDIQEGASLALELGSGVVISGGERPPLGWDTFEQFYTWLPWNIFVGPSERSDDPGNNIDINARSVVGNDPLFGELVRLNRLMLEYNSGLKDRLNAILNIMTQLSKHKTIYPLDSDDWIYSHGKYHIRTPQYLNIKSHSYKNSTSVIITSNQSCLLLYPNFVSALVNFGVI